MTRSDPVVAPLAAHEVVPLVHVHCPPPTDNLPQP